MRVLKVATSLLALSACQVSVGTDSVPLHELSVRSERGRRSVEAAPVAYRAVEEVIERSPNVKAVTRITSLGGVREAGVFSLSPGGDELVYQAFEGTSSSGHFNLWKCSTTGSAASTQLTTGRYFDMFPRYDQSGEAVLFSSNRSSMAPDLWRVKTTGAGGLVRITSGSSVDIQPSWGPPGTMLAYFTSIPENASEPQLWRVHLDGSLPTQLREGEEPALSPDGTRIAYTVFDDRSKLYSIWVMDVDGSNQTQLTLGAEGSQRHPAWSPDGQRIVFSSDEGLDSNGERNFDIWIMDVDGSHQTQLTTNGSTDIHPAFSSDGRQVYFLSNRGLHWDIWRMEIVDA